MFDKYFENEYNNNKEVMDNTNLFHTSVSLFGVFILSTGILNYPFI